jgi:hypothetical protein
MRPFTAYSLNWCWPLRWQWGKWESPGMTWWNFAIGPVRLNVTHFK